MKCGSILTTHNCAVYREEYFMKFQGISDCEPLEILIPSQVVEMKAA